MSQTPPELSQVLSERYRIEREIGRGGMATVYLAEDLKHRRQVAIKVLSPQLAAALGPERFLREIEFAARLTHPHILPLFDSGASGTHFYYVTPFVEGRSLRDRLQQEKQLGLEEAIRIAREVASALSYAHGQGIVHRDIKPENVLLTDGAALVADFGIARALSGEGDGSLTQTGIVLGTPSYMSPEQASGGPIDARADLYSLGCLLYEMLAGEPPFTGPTLHAIQSRHALEAVPPLTARRPGIPESVERAVLRSLAKTPADRHPSAARFAEALNLAVVGATTPVAAGDDQETQNNLPRARTSFVGRDRELAECARLLGETRLLTLTGVGGSGKTRLALRLAETMLDNHPDGVWLIDLAAAETETVVAQSLATTIGIKQESGRDLLESITERLSGKRVLLVLDNCEHLLRPTSDLADRLLAGLPDVKILATSREGLGVSGERIFAVQSLAVPAASEGATPEAIAESESAKLFVARARDADREFSLDESNAEAVAEICRRLDGIPLAIELAAVRTRALSVHQIRDMLDDRFRLLTGGSRSALERHRTLRATVQWSYDHLEPDEQELFVALSTFPGGWTLPAATALAGGDEFDVLDRLSRLIDKSLVIPIRRGNQEARYRMLETLRQFGQELLATSGRADELRGRHFDYLRGLVEGMKAELSQPFPFESVRRLLGDIDNIRAALTWGFVHRPTEATYFVLLLARLWFTPGFYAEGRRWLALAMEHESELEPRVLAEVLFRSGRLAFQQGDYDEASAKYAREHTIFHELKDARLEAHALVRLGNVLAYSGRYGESLEILQRAMELHSRLDDENGRGRLENSIGLTLFLSRDYAAARERFEAALAIFRPKQNQDRIQVGLGNLSMVYLKEGDGAKARELLHECLAINRTLENLYGIAHYLPALAGALRLVGEREAGARALGAAEALLEKIEAALESVERDVYDEVLAALREEMGEEAFERERGVGRELDWREAIELA